MTRYADYECPFGFLRIGCTDEAVVSIERVETGEREEKTALSEYAYGELRAYFDGTRSRFTFPIAPEGTPFQQEVWTALRAIPYGETRTYGQVAAAVGRPRAARAVGMANHCNPLLIVTPCHRVVGANGALTGFAAGLDMKRALLALEQRNREALSAP